MYFKYSHLLFLCIFLLTLYMHVGINKLLINPKHGHQFGGTPIIIAGLCYKSTDKVRCLFGSSTMVDGVVLDSDEALCVSPVMSETGPIKLRLILNNVTIATTVFSIGKYIYVQCLGHEILE